MNFVPLLVGTSVTGLRCPAPLARGPAAPRTLQTGEQSKFAFKQGMGCQWAP